MENNMITEQEPALASERLYVVDNRYLHVQRTDDGFDYALYDKDTGREIDGGQLNSDLPLIKDAAAEICKLHDLPFSELQPADIAILNLLEMLASVSPVAPKKNTVWVLRWDWSLESGESGDGCEVYADRASALKAFKAFVDSIKNEDYKGVWDNPDSGFCVEEYEWYFSIWKEQNYHEAHSTVLIDEHFVLTEKDI